MELHYTNLLIVVAVGFAAPLVLGFIPKLRMPSVVLELVAGIVVGPSVLGWVHVDPPVAVLSAVGLAILLFLAGLELGDRGEVRVDERMSAGDGIWAIGDVTGVWPLTYVGKYQGRVVAANLLGRDARASYDAVPRVVFTDPQAVSVGEPDGAKTARVELSGVARTSTYTRAYDTKPGFLTLVSDGERLTGAYALGPEAGEWLGQATLAIRAGVTLETMLDTIQPFPTFSEAYLDALRELLGR